jgi:hypothetical protein
MWSSFYNLIAVQLLEDTFLKDRMLFAKRNLWISIVVS